MNSAICRQDKVKTLHRSTKLRINLGSRSPAGQKHRQPKRSGLASTVRARQSQSVDLPLADRDTLLRQRALAEAHQKNYGEAIALFNLLIERNPSNASDYNNRGLVYFQSGQMDAAIADYNQAIDLNPGLDSVYNNRANYYAVAGQLFEALMDYDTALDLNPSNVRAWINQGITFRELEMYDQAIESFDLALCFGQLEGHVYAERGRTYHFSGSWNGAIADYQRAIDALSAQREPSAARLSTRVEVWLTELLSPLQF